jgi:hypothetical protein
MLRHVGSLALAVTLVPAMPAAPLAAQSVAPETLLQSNAMFAQGKRELAQGQTAAACVSFAQSFRLVPRGGTLLNLGLCREQEGSLSEAYRLLRSALTVAQREGREDRVPLAREHIAALESRLSFAALALPHDIDPSLVALRVDSGAIAQEEWTGVPLEPGEHVLTAEAVGFESWSTKLSVGTTPARLVVPIGPLSPTAGPGAASAAARAPAPPAAHPLAPVAYEPLRKPEASAARAARAAVQRAALEGWFVEASLGITASMVADSYVKTLRAFDYSESELARATLDAALGYMLTRRLGLVFHYARLERRRYDTPGQAMTGQRYVFSWHTQAVMAGLRFRQPIASHWLVAFADLTAGLSFSVSALQYEVSAGAGYLSQRDDQRDRSVALRGIAGLQFGFTEHVGAFIAGGYAYAPALVNLVHERHDSGGPVFLTGLRLNSVKGWW